MVTLQRLVPSCGSLDPKGTFARRGITYRDESIYALTQLVFSMLAPHFSTINEQGAACTGQLINVAHSLIGLGCLHMRVVIPKCVSGVYQAEAIDVLNIAFLEVECK